MLKLEETEIPKDIAYQDILNLASEARQKLEIGRSMSYGPKAGIWSASPLR